MRFPVFPFDPIQKDSLHEWVSFTVALYATYKSNQNKYFSSYYIQQPIDRVHTNLTKVEKIQRAKTANESFYIDGQYQVIDDQYEIIPAVRNRKTGKVIEERRFIGKDLFLLMDSVGNFVIQSAGLTSAQLEENPDLSVREIGSDNLGAIKHFMLAFSGLGNYAINLEKAIELDSTFAMAALFYATRNNFYQRGDLETKQLIDQAMRHRKRSQTRQRTGTNYYWKQDSTIWQAEELLKTGEYEKAQTFYEKAIEQHPEHFYLQQAKQHIDYVQAKSEAELQENFQRFVGQYGEIDIWIEDGLLYYKRPGVARRIFRPFSRNRFTTLLNYSFNYEIVERDGQVVGIQGYFYNNEKKEWEKVKDWYFDRTQLLD